jgi:hypothetical protein
MPLEEFPISVFFFPLGKKSPKVETQSSLFGSKFPFSKPSPQILVLGGGGEGRGEADWLLFERSYTKTDTN